MTASESPDQRYCKLAAESLATEKPDVLHVVIGADDAEALAYVTDDCATVLTRNGDLVSYTKHGGSSFSHFADAPDRLADPFRGAVARSGSSADFTDALSELVSGISGIGGVEPPKGGVEVYELDEELRRTADEYDERVTDSAEAPIVVTDLDNYTVAHPSQWHGITSDGVPVYAKHKRGRVELSAGGRRGHDGETLYTAAVETRHGMDTAELVDAVPEDVARFDVDPEDVADVADAEFDVEGLRSLARETDGYDRDREFVAECRDVRSTAREFARTFTAIEFVGEYLRAHPDQNCPDFALDGELRQRHRLLAEVADAFDDAIGAVEERGEYAEAASALGRAVEYAESVKGKLKHTPGVPAAVDWERHPAKDFSHEAYRTIFDRLDRLHERAVYEASSSTHD